ncbi:hypothetical protein AK812_SmicGene1912 [Symbiodinium microadriaticum]|uniref:Uncharacterized protein n=1 Tax=Symbiodinium microadriaticum TaxID=2951 RepID=A0A1Q9F2R2_SYMMI|nr:hypothetical protein AK812_SmicGene1912 [Symbiodinium microadriaticum]
MRAFGSAARAAPCGWRVRITWSLAQSIETNPFTRRPSTHRLTHRTPGSACSGGEGSCSESAALTSTMVTSALARIHPETCRAVMTEGLRLRVVSSSWNRMGPHPLGHDLHYLTYSTYLCQGLRLQVVSASSNRMGPHPCGHCRPYLTAYSTSLTYLFQGLRLQVISASWDRMGPHPGGHYRPYLAYPTYPTYLCQGLRLQVVSASWDRMGPHPGGHYRPYLVYPTYPTYLCQDPANLAWARLSLVLACLSVDWQVNPQSLQPAHNHFLPPFNA